MLDESYLKNIFEQVDEQLIKFWKKNNIFQKSIDTRPQDNSFTFFDGPPFPSGTPHHGHLMVSALKDAVARYWTMKGYRVERKWGWDCHGIYVEQKVEQKLGIKDRREIGKSISLEEFIQACYNYVQNVSEAWPWYVDHIGRWVDMQNAYWTLDKDYMESVIWAFKQIYDKGDVYKGKKVVLYCPRCATPLSKFEIAMANSYKELEDPSVVVKFKVKYHKSGLGVGAVIEDQEGKILMAMRNEPGRKKVWGIVGGKKDAEDKDIFETVKREVKEEIGVDVKGMTYYGFSIDIFEGRLFKTHHFKVQITGDIKTNNELVDLRWVSKEAIPWDNIHIPTKNCLKDVLEGKPCEQEPGLDKPNVYLLVWTTTPWTLPQNAAVAVDPKQTYVTVEHQGEYYILAKARLEQVFKDKEYKIVDEYKGQELVGLSYEPVFDYFVKQATDKDFKVYPAEFVSMEEGTGLVHMAPAYGEDDYNLAQKYGISVFEAVDEFGQITLPDPKVKGKFFKEADKEFINMLQEKGVLFDVSTVRHSYPVCHRCGTPLLYMAFDSYFINIKDNRDKLLETAKQVNWVPKHIKKMFENMLSTRPEWNITRTRYWSVPIPIWVCDHCGHEVALGSIKEIEEKSKKKVTDLHRPYIDEHTWRCQKCNKGTMRRVPEVIDVWFESGSMPYASRHYPFENKEEFENNFPADFITEGLDQVRGWFNALHTISSLIFEKPAYKNVICAGVILAADGRKMSKSLGNYTDPSKLLRDYGADAFRLYVLSSPVVVGDKMSFKDHELAGVLRDIILPLYNIYRYLAIYVNKHGFTPEGREEVYTKVLKGKGNTLLDKWIIHRLAQFAQEFTKQMEEYNIMQASRLIRFMVDDISMWYIKLSRHRFVAADADALNVLLWGLLDFIHLIAPIVPFITEYIYQKMLPLLKRVDSTYAESVHLNYLPEFKFELDARLLDNMQLVRDIVSAGHRLRVDAKLPVKQPLSELVVMVKDDTVKGVLSNFTDIIATELNVDNVTVVTENEKEELAGNKHYMVAEDKRFIVYLNTKITEELKARRYLREIIRSIQTSRKALHLKVGQRAKVVITTPPSEVKYVKDIVEKNKENIASQTDAIDLVVQEAEQFDCAGGSLHKIGAEKIQICVKIVPET